LILYFIYVYKNNGGDKQETDEDTIV